MLKIVGAFLVFAGALGIGNSISKRLKQHYHQLIALKELLLLMGNEMRYLKTPLPQALKRIAGQCEAPFGEVLIQTADELLKYLEASPGKVWKKVLQSNRSDYLLSEEEYQIFIEAGNILEQSNTYMQKEEVALFTEQVQFKLVHAQEELRTKQRISRYLCGAGGLFLILLLL
jgi:stage III sporulation protein AB